MNLKSSLFEHNNNPNRIVHEDADAIQRISHTLVSMLPDPSRPVVIACIGTDRSTGDSLGPLVGTLLKEQSSLPFFVYGTLEDPIHALNLKERLQEIYTAHLTPFIIGVDACLGKVKSVGIVQIGEGPVKPGAGVNKDLPAVGDAHITGIVNVSGFMEFMVLQNTRLNLVMNMAQTIAKGIQSAGTQFRPKPALSHFSWMFNQEKTP